MTKKINIGFSKTLLIDITLAKEILGIKIFIFYIY